MGATLSRAVDGQANDLRITQASSCAGPVSRQEVGGIYVENTFADGSRYDSSYPRSDIPYSGRNEWFDSNGQTHRDLGLPACIKPWGEISWYSHGRLHREKGLPAEISHCPSSRDGPETITMVFSNNGDYYHRETIKKGDPDFDKWLNHYKGAVAASDACCQQQNAASPRV